VLRIPAKKWGSRRFPFIPVFRPTHYYRFYFRFARRELAAPRALALLLRPPAAFFTTRFAARRTRGFALATFFVSASCTAPAFAAIVPRVDPIDSATLVRIASSFDDLPMSTVTLLYPRFHGVATSEISSTILKLAVALE
jgi:hypothetical protein